MYIFTSYLLSQFIFKQFNIFNYLFLAVPGLCCFAGFSLVAVSWGYSPVAVPGLLIVMASLVAEHALYRTRTSVDVTRGLSAVALELRLNSYGTWS